MRRTLTLCAALPAALVIASLNSGPAVSGSASDVEGSVLARVDTSDGAASAVPLRSLGPSVSATDPDAPMTGTPPGEAPDLPEAAESAGRTSSEGFLVAAGGGVHGTGQRWRYTVEVEPATGLDLDDVVREVTLALTDERSWAATRTLEQVGDPAAARIRLLIATPDTVDRLCAQVGLRTAGIFSCWNGRFAALNSWRWEVGATGFEDIRTYRSYLVNHEFGHGLGYGHVGCPSQGGPAPVMMQQSKGLDGCRPNGWPYP